MGSSLDIESHSSDVFDVQSNRSLWPVQELLLDAPEAGTLPLLCCLQKKK